MRGYYEPMPAFYYTAHKVNPALTQFCDYDRRQGVYFYLLRGGKLHSSILAFDKDLYTHQTSDRTYFVRAVRERELFVVWRLHDNGLHSVVPGDLPSVLNRMDNPCIGVVFSFLPLPPSLRCINYFCYVVSGNCCSFPPLVGDYNKNTFKCDMLTVTATGPSFMGEFLGCAVFHFDFNTTHPAISHNVLMPHHRARNPQTRTSPKQPRRANSSASFNLRRSGLIVVFLNIRVRDQRFATIVAEVRVIVFRQSFVEFKSHSTIGIPNSVRILYP